MLNLYLIEGNMKSFMSKIRRICRAVDYNRMYVLRCFTEVICRIDVSMGVTALKTFWGDTVFTVKIVGIFNTEARRRWKSDFTKRSELELNIYNVNWWYDRNGIRWQKDLYKTWLRVCILIKTNSELHDVLCSNWQRVLSSGTKFLDIRRIVFEKGVSIDRSWVEYRNGRQWTTVSIT